MRKKKLYYVNVDFRQLEKTKFKLNIYEFCWLESDDFQ